MWVPWAHTHSTLCVFDYRILGYPGTDHHVAYRCPALVRMMMVVEVVVVALCNTVQSATQCVTVCDHV